MNSSPSTESIIAAKFAIRSSCSSSVQGMASKVATCTIVADQHPHVRIFSTMAHGMVGIVEGYIATANLFGCTPNSLSVMPNHLSLRNSSLGKACNVVCGPVADFIVPILDKICKSRIGSRTTASSKGHVLSNILVLAGSVLFGMAPSALVCPPLGNLCQLITPLQLIHVSGCGLSLTIEALCLQSFGNPSPQLIVLGHDDVLVSLVSDAPGANLAAFLGVGAAVLAHGMDGADAAVASIVLTLGSLICLVASWS